MDDVRRNPFAALSVVCFAVVVLAAITGGSDGPMVLLLGIGFVAGLIGWLMARNGNAPLKELAVIGMVLHVGFVLATFLFEFVWG